MMEHWNWITIGTLAALVIYQYFRVCRVRGESRNREELFQIVTENAADMIALVDVKGHRLYNSPAYKRILGYSAAELGETSALEQIHPEDRFKVLEAAREARSTGVGKKLEYRIRHKDGSWRVLESIAGTIRDEKGDVTKLVIVNRDITDRKHAEEQAEHNSLHDALTGLPNRTLFLDRLEQLYLRTQRNPERPYALLFVDLDNFKEINDSLGHTVGDGLLQSAATRLQACLRGSDTVSRQGGDEFLVLLTEVTSVLDTDVIADKLKKAMAESHLIGNHQIRVTLSIGISLYPDDGSEVGALLSHADTAMYFAKRSGRNAYRRFSSDMLEDSAARRSS